jgi:hypothetical protein
MKMQILGISPDLQQKQLDLLLRPTKGLVEHP